MFKIALTFIFSAIASAVLAQNATDTFKLYFDLNVAKLNEKTQNQIDLLIYNDQIIPGSDVMIIGYADYLGAEKYNKNLSQQRAENVEQYLVKYGIDKKNIKLCIGKGEVERTGLTGAKGYPADRRVDIIVNGQLDAPQNVPPLSDTSVADPDVKTIDVTKYHPGQTFVLQDIYFFPESHRIRPESMPVLETLYKTLNENPRLKIRIEGHVCCIVDYPDAIDMDNHDDHLSVNRAKTIYDYLVDKGIDKKRLQFAGYGKSRPIVLHEKTEEDANKNRRVEIRILEK